MFMFLMVVCVLYVHNFLMLFVCSQIRDVLSSSQGDGAGRGGASAPPDVQGAGHGGFPTAQVREGRPVQQ